MMDTEDNIFQEFWKRFKAPWCVAFTLYFIVVIIVMGGFGVILSILSNEFDPTQKMAHIASNFSTFSLALIMPAVISILLSFLQIQNKVSAILVCVVSIAISFGLLYLCHNTFGGIALFCSLVNTVLALFCWVIANHDNVLLNDKSYDNMVKTEIKKHGKDWN